MAKTRPECRVECPACHTVLGSVVAVEDELRPGFWVHTSTPERIPTTCPSCLESAVRIELT